MRLGPVFGGRLHRRMFMMFGMSIVATFVCFMLVKRVVDGGWNPGGQSELTRIKAFIGGQFKFFTPEVALFCQVGVGGQLTGFFEFFFRQFFEGWQVGDEVFPSQGPSGF